MLHLATLGTRPDLALPKTGGSSDLMMQGAQAILALLLVAALLKWVLPKLIAKFQDSKTTKAGMITVEDSAPFGAGTLQVVAIEGQRLLLHSGPQGVVRVAELTAPTSQTEDEAFFEVLDRKGMDGPGEPISDTLDWIDKLSQEPEA